MKLRLKEDPREWRKNVWLTALGLTLLSSLLRWRRVLPQPAWLAVLALAGLAALGVLLCPRWFRGYYRVSMRVGFWLSQVLARVALALIFVLLLTPLGLLLRLAGKDPLRLKRPPAAGSYWTPAREPSSLDRLF